MRVIFLGPSGSGKGTQSRLLCERIGLVYIGAGDMLRAARDSGTELGARVRPYLEAGQLVPDELINDLIADRLDGPDRPDRFVIDGYPRTVAQAHALDRLLEGKKVGLTAVLLLRVPDEELIRRAMGRQRHDDQEETLRQRLAIFHRETSAIAAHYRAKGLLHEITGVGPVEEIYNSIVKILNP